MADSNSKDSTAGAVIVILAVMTVLGLGLAVLLHEPGTEPPGFALDSGGARAFDTALLILRASLGMMIFVHGYNKAFRGGRIAGTGRWFHSMGMRPGVVHAALAAYAEMAVGALLVVGLLTQVAAAGLIGVMAVAFWTVHRGKGFMITGEGWEYVAFIALMCCVCAILGPGPISLDNALDIADRLNGWTGLGIAVLLGVGTSAAQLLLFYRPNAPTDA